MEIYFYSQFEKKENSTKEPPLYSSSITLTGYLREPCSVTEPVIRIKREYVDGSEGTVVQYTYAWIPAFNNRYYYVTDWVWADGLWEVHMKVDVLASYRLKIGGMSAYIDRSSCGSAVNNAIPDVLYPATYDLRTYEIPFTPKWKRSTISPSNIFFVIGIVGVGSVTGVGYYAMTATMMHSLMSYLLDTNFYNDNSFNDPFSQISVLTAKSMVNPLQYITSCFQFEMNVNDIDHGSLEYIKLGPWNIPQSRNIKGYFMGTLSEMNDTITIPLTNAIHPQAPTRGKYLNYSPYSEWTLHCPPFGTIPVDPGWFDLESTNPDSMKLNVYIDGGTGKARLVINVHHYNSTSSSYEDYPISEHSCMLGFPVELSQVSVDYFHAGVTAVQSISSSLNSYAMGFATMNPGAMQAGENKLVAGYASAIDSLRPQLLTTGTNGSWVGLEGKTCLIAKHNMMVDEDNTEFGKPVCSTWSISQLRNLDLSAQDTFIKCREAHVDFPCYDYERKLITDYMLNGFFYV